MASRTFCICLVICLASLGSGLIHPLVYLYAHVGTFFYKRHLAFPFSESLSFSLLYYISITLESLALSVVTTKPTPICQESPLSPLSHQSHGKGHLQNISLWQVSHTTWKCPEWNFLSQEHFIHLNSVPSLTFLLLPFGTCCSSCNHLQFFSCLLLGTACSPVASLNPSRPLHHLSVPAQSGSLCSQLPPEVSTPLSGRISILCDTVHSQISPAVPQLL